jgi:hypothetical protein
MLIETLNVKNALSNLKNKRRRIRRQRLREPIRACLSLQSPDSASSRRIPQPETVCQSRKPSHRIQTWQKAIRKLSVHTAARSIPHRIRAPRSSGLFGRRHVGHTSNAQGLGMHDRPSTRRSSQSGRRHGRHA